MTKAIIFDLDGVIIDTERTVWLTSSINLLALYNKTHEAEKVEHMLYGSKFEDGTRIMYGYYDISDSFENFLDKRRKFVYKGFAENVDFMEGFEDFFKRLTKNKKAIATSMDTQFLELTLQHLPLKSFFGSHIYTIADSGGRGKPHPDIFLYAADKLGQDPADCIVIEDAPKGIAAAKSAGMKAIGITKSVSADKLVQADCVVDSFEEISDEMLL